MAKKNNRSNYEKTILEQTEELIQSLLIIRDSVDAINQGKEHFWIPIYGQLRALIVQSKMNDPILIRLASRFGVSTRVYRMRLPHEDENTPEVALSADIHFAGLPITTTRILPSQSETNLSSLIKDKLLRSHGEEFDLSRIIKYFAEKAGGAHYDTTVPEDELIISQMIPNTSLVQEICQVVVSIGSRVVSEITNFEFYIKLLIPDQTLVGDHTLVEHRVAGSPQSMRIFLRNGVLTFFVSDFLGRHVLLSTETVTPLAKPFLLRYYIETLPTLRQRIVVAIDHAKVREFELQRALLFTNNISEYDTVYNGSYSNEEPGIEMKFAEMVAFHKLVEGDDSWRIGEYFARKEEKGLKFISFHKGSKGRSLPGSNNIIFEGNVRRD